MLFIVCSGFYASYSVWSSTFVANVCIPIFYVITWKLNKILEQERIFLALWAEHKNLAIFFNLVLPGRLGTGALAQVLLECNNDLI